MAVITQRTTGKASLMMITATLMLAMAGCAGSDTVPITIDDLNAAVGSAAQRVLDAPAVQVTTQWFDEDGAHVRTDYLDYRSDNTFLLLTQMVASTHVEVDEMAIIQVTDNRFCATAGPNLYCDVEDPQTNEPWSIQIPLGVETGPTRIPISLDLEAMAAGEAGSIVAGVELSATRNDIDGGGVVWTLTSPNEGVTFIQEWTIRPDGSLHSYTAGAETGLPFGLYSKAQFDFLIPGDPAPITSPALDARLDTGALNLPQELPLFER